MGVDGADCGLPEFCKNYYWVVYFINRDEVATIDTTIFVLLL